MSHYCPSNFKTIFLTMLLLVSDVLAQSNQPSMASIQASAQNDLRTALQNLEETEKQITDDKLVISTELLELEQAVINLRQQLKAKRGTQDNEQIEFQELQQRHDSLEAELNYTQNALQDFSIWLQSTVHPAELPLYADDLTNARSSILTEDAQPNWESILQTLSVAENRANRQLGGDVTQGRAVAANGTLGDGSFLQYGPMVWFLGSGKGHTGLASEQMDSEWPIIRPVNEETVTTLRNLIETGKGRIPILDPKKQHNTQSMPEENLMHHIKEGGFVMIPILGMALVAIWVCILKMFDLLRNPLVSHETSQYIQSFAPKTDLQNDPVHKTLKSIKGLSRELMESAIRPSTSEEGVFHRLYCIRETLERQVSLLSVIAATAPLLGLLGTVVGMIKTFEFITVFGVGDPRHLSGGISEALITTEFGLGVAIPCLLAHAYYQRKVRGRLHQYEHLADLLYEASHPNQSKATD